MEKNKNNYKLLFSLLVLLLQACSVNPRLNETPIFVPSVPLQLQWKTDIQNTITTIAISDRLIIAGSSSGIFAIDPKTGDKLWDKGFHLDSNSPILMTENTLIAATLSQIRVYSLSGQEISVINIVTETGGYFRLLDVFANYLFIIRQPGWILEVYDMDKEIKIWSATARPGGMSFGFDKLNGIVYIASNQSIRAFEVLSGKMIWEVALGVHNCVYESSIFYCRDLDNIIFAFNLKDQTKIWFANKLPDSQTEVGGLAIFREMVLIYTNFGIAAIDKLDGRYLWISDSKDNFNSKPILLGDTLYAKGASSKIIYVMSFIDGHTLGDIELVKSPVLYENYAEYSLGIYKSNDNLIIPIGNNIFAYRSK